MRLNMNVTALGFSLKAKISGKDQLDLMYKAIDLVRAQKRFPKGVKDTMVSKIRLHLDPMEQPAPFVIEDQEDYEPNPYDGTYSED